MNGESGNMYTKAKHSPDDKRSIFFLRFLRYIDLFPLICLINKGMSVWCFFTNLQKCLQEKRNKMSA